MASVFSPCLGGVTRVDLNCSQGGTLFKIQLNPNLTLPVTGFALELQGNYQFLHTVNDFIFLYTFGDRIGELVLTGMGFFDNGCGNFVENNGICAALGYYAANRVAKRDGPIDIVLGQCGGFKGFLTGMRIEVVRPESLVAQWVLRFNVLPMDE